MAQLAVASLEDGAAVEPWPEAAAVFEGTAVAAEAAATAGPEPEAEERPVESEWAVWLERAAGSRQVAKAGPAPAS